MQCVPSLCVLLVLLLVSLSTRVQADTVYLKGGGRIDGKIVKQDETWVHVETRKFGVQKIRRQNILRVLTAEDEYEERKKACGAEDAKARYELGLWCKENTLFKQAYQEFRAALKADPDHELARQELGYVRRGDRWVPKDDPIARRYPYAQATIYNLARLTEGEKAWVEPGDPWNDQGLLEREHEPTGLRFVLIPGGVFRMGSDVASEEQPVHEVRLKPFLLCRTECTERAWIRLGGSRIKRKRGANHPVCGRSFHDLICWFQKADLRLPSEAEWEYACRAGGKGRWSHGNDVSALKAYAWFRGNVAGVGPYKTAQLLPNPWGLFDLHGNVKEVCADGWSKSYQGAPTDGGARENRSTGFGSVGGAHRLTVVRGGYWLSTASRCRSAAREFTDMEGGSGDFEILKSNLGLRPARSLPDHPLPR
jgi:formylglycine-generating enzyme required for sulfatase activity